MLIVGHWNSEEQSWSHSDCALFSIW